MKKSVCLFVMLLILLCGCSKGDWASQFHVGNFSYTDDCAYYYNDPGVVQAGFVNTEKTELKSIEQVVELAKKECTVEYDTIDVAFDADLKIHRVSFYKEDWLGGNQDVYINEQGVTQLIIYGE